MITKHSRLLSAFISTQALLAVVPSQAQPIAPDTSTPETHPAFRDPKKKGPTVLGIGIKATQTEDGLRIDALMTKGPAIKAGISAGDIITHIDGIPTKGRTQKENFEAILNDKTWDVKIGYRKLGGNAAATVTLDKTLVTPDTQYVTAQPAPPAQAPPPPRVAYNTVITPGAEVRVNPDVKSRIQGRLAIDSCLFVETQSTLAGGFVKVNGTTPREESFTGVMESRHLKPRDANDKTARCFAVPVVPKP